MSYRLEVQPVLKPGSERQDCAGHRGVVYWIDHDGRMEVTCTGVFAGAGAATAARLQALNLVREHQAFLEQNGERIEVLAPPARRPQVAARAAPHQP